MPITWQNINIGSNQSANALIANGADKITDSLTSLGGVVDDINKERNNIWSAKAEVNTEDL